MFEPPPALRGRPMFAVSAAAHAALAIALVVPPLLATPEPPEPDGFVRIEHIPPLASDAGAREKVILLRKEEGPRAASPRASAPPAGPRTDTARAPLTQPHGITSVLPAPTGDPEDLLPLEEISSGERREPSSGGNRREGGTANDGGGGCEGCPVLSATAPGVTPPVALETVSPAYPELARKIHVEGVVLLEAIIGADGSVRDVRVLRSAHALLEPAALEAVRRWRYRPARIDGRPVAVSLSVVVTFALR